MLGTGNFGWASANASAGSVGTPSGGCLYVLDPSGKDAINASNNAHIDPSCGVYVNSSNAEAVLVTGSANITTSGTPQPPINVVGGVNVNNGGSLSPGATTTAAVADPLAGLDVPWTELHRQRLPDHEVSIHGMQRRGPRSATILTLSSVRTRGTLLIPT
jgi:hypothetical protein